mgnify:CR=1 FL=1
MERLSPKEALIQFKKARSLSFACTSKEDGGPVDQAIFDLEAEFDRMGWVWQEKGE